jgi:uncharacterized protein (TIGR03435 family)
MKLAVYGLLAGVLLAQTASFDAASIKPSDAPAGSSTLNTNNGFLRAENVTLKRCIYGAYGVPEAQILGGPKWIGELRFNIVAKAEHAPAGVGTEILLQALLADRFHLVLHHETQSVSGYSLAVAKGGIKATVTEPGTPYTTNSSRTRIDAKNTPVSALVGRLTGILSVPVVDETGDSRRFDFTLQWVPDAVMAQAAPGSEIANGPSIFTAVQEQLGLKLEARKVPVDFIVVDRADPPTEN